MRLRKKKNKHGPFRANRILDTSEVKIDQVYTKDENPVALFVTITEDEAKKIGAEGYFGPTKFGAEGKYERGKTWVTRAIYFPAGIPDTQFTEDLGKQMSGSVAVGGTVVPTSIQFEKAELEKTYPISDSASLRVVDDMHVMIDGKIVLSPPSRPTFMRRLCPYCNNEIDVAYKKCPFCGKQV
ncbi:MAG: hypothetical protein D4S01_01440 [Dehalococcoidia bacterium]|nr:MAG: hypothetical protein D4S01_01440 [Dehalococcoidia bacterium]